MDKIFIGLLLIFFNFNITVNGIAVNILPDFCGYLVMLLGVNELVDESERFKKVRAYIIFMTCYTAFAYTIGLFTHMPTSNIFLILLGLMSTVLHLYILYLIIVGIKDMEDSYDEEMNTDMMYPEWKYLSIFSILTYALLIVPTLSSVSIIISFIIEIAFIVSFYKASKMYRNRSFLYKEQQELMISKEIDERIH